MAWNSIDNLQTATSGAAAISVSLQIKSGNLRFIVGIGAQAVEALAWSAGERVSVEVGEGEHAGLLRLGYNVPPLGEGGTLRPRGTAGGLSLTLLPWGGLPGKPRPAKRCGYHRYKAAERWAIEIELPSWAQRAAAEPACD